MEKISNIVRGNARVAATDVGASGAVRPGAPAYGRVVGESPQGPEHQMSTAARAVSIQNEMSEMRKTDKSRKIVDDMSNQFFTRRTPEAPQVNPASTASVTDSVPVVGAREEMEVPGQAHIEDEVQVAAPSGYRPRGSYLDVRA